MNVSPAGIAFIQKHEGCVLHVYKDEAGIPTIGWGHARWSGASPITQAQADALLVADLRPCESAVRQHVHVELTQSQFDACVSFVFNCGAGAFASSSILRCINIGEPKAAALAFMLWDKVTDPHTKKLVVSANLAARRLEEAMLFYGVDPRAAAPDT